MATKSETNYAKMILLSANIIFAIIGFLFLVGKAWMNSQFNTSTYVKLGIFGMLLVTFTYLGFFSKLKKDDFMVIIFSACLLIIFIAEMSMGLSEAQKNYKSQFVKKMLNKYPYIMETIDSQSFMNLDIEEFQIEYKCCGWMNATDWLDFELPIPASCCTDPKVNNATTTTNCTILSTNFHNTGCYIKYRKHNINAKYNLKKENKEGPNSISRNLDDNCTICSTNDTEITTDMDYDYSTDLEFANVTDDVDFNYRTKPDEPVLDKYEEDESSESGGGGGGGGISNYKYRIPAAVFSSLLG